LKKHVVVRRRSGYEHEVEMREHRLIVDEPEDKGGTDQGPAPSELLAASLGSCTAITIEMYADRKEWGLGTLEVAVDYTQPTVDNPPTFDVTITLGAELSEETRDRLLTIAGKCPVHKALMSQNVVIHDSLEFIDEAEDED
jgi:putative redox protein